MVWIFILILSLINFVNTQNSTDLSDSKITYVLAETPTKLSNTLTKNETADSTAIKTNPTSNDSVMTYSMEGPSSAATGNETAVPESPQNSTSENKTTTTAAPVVTKVNQTNAKTTQASKKPNVFSTTPAPTNVTKSSIKISNEANNNASDYNTNTTTPSNSNSKNVTDSSNGTNGNGTTSAYGNENYVDGENKTTTTDDSSNNTTPNSNNTQNTNSTTKPPPNNGKVYKENECHYNYTKGGRRGPDNHYHCHNRRWIWGLVSVITFFVLIAFCVLCCRLCLGICLCTAIGNRATQQPRVNPYNQRTIYANDTIFLPPVPVYTMHANLNPFPLQTKGYHIHGGRPGTF